MLTIIIALAVGAVLASLTVVRKAGKALIQGARDGANAAVEKQQERANIRMFGNER